MDKQERQRIMREIRQKAAEIAITPDMPDDVSEMALFSLGLEGQFNALQRIGHDDPIGVTMFGDRPGWLDKRLD
jgi:hypothetical protein